MRSSDPAERITRSRTKLYMDGHRYFAQLASRLTPREAPGMGTVGTDGTYLYYDPDALAKWTDPELTGVLVHEALHCGMLHVYRAGDRDMERWNVACDEAINPIVLAAGFTLPAGGCHDPQYAGMSAETIYARLPAGVRVPNGMPVFTKAPDGTPQPGPAAPGTPAPAPAAPGTPAPAPDAAPAPGAPAPAPLTETSWQIAAEQAALAQENGGYGLGDGGAARATRAARATNTGWDALKRFVQAITPSDYSWTRPARAYLGAGIVLPGVTRDGAPPMGIAVDTSGSIDSGLLDRFASEVNRILADVRPEWVEVVYCDTRVQRVERFYPDDGDVEIKAAGGGGTRFQPALDHFTGLADDGEPVACVVYLTDLDAGPPEEPEYPVLWAVPESCAYPAPFGERVVLGVHNG